jgi:hypothetical protein
VLIEPGSRHRWRDVLVIFLTTRTSLFLVGWLATYLLTSGAAAQPGNLRYQPPAPGPLQAWVHWDAQWYLLIADRGYGALEEDPSLAPRNLPQDTSGFFPLYPGLVRAVSALTRSSVIGALLVSNLALLGFLFLLHRWASERHGEEAGRGAVVAACVFPTSLFLSAPYSESLFLLLALGAVLAARHQRHLLAGVLAAAASLARPVGLLLALPLAWGAADRATPARTRMLRLASALGAPAGLALFAGFCHLRFGDPLAFLARQERWRGGLAWPWTFLVEYVQGPHAHGRTGSTVDLVMALLCLGLLPAVFRRAGTASGLFATAALLLPLSSGLFSFSRLALAAYPLFLVLGVGWARRWEIRLALAAVGLPFAGLFMALYGTGWWVG